MWLAERIEEEVLSGDHLVDAQLPTELELADRYQVSRQVVREAARLLEDRGLVNIRPRRGMTVAAPSSASVVARYQSVLRRGRATFAQLMELRRIVEPDMTALAAASRSDADVDAMQLALERSRANVHDYRACLEADLSFHLAVSNATQNPFIAAFVEPINTVLREMYTEPIGYLATQESTIREHTAIAAAIAAGDAAAARAGALVHLDRIYAEAGKLVAPN
ncbi:MAG TPA: FCD domain-containing protein [Solirubrobacter sp.]|nr:FCD domain-containing protein [Solirubrobacter sp.]